MFCRKCGSKLADDAKFCQQCGCSVDSSTLNSSVSPMTQSAQGNSSAGFPDRTNNILGSGSPTNASKVSYAILALTGMNIFTTISFLLTMYTSKVYEFSYYFGSDSVSFFDLVKILFSNETSNEVANNISFPVWMCVFIILPAVVLSSVCIIRAVISLLQDGFGEDNSYELSKMKTSSISSCVQLATLFIFKFAGFKGTAVSFSALFYLLIIVVVSSLVLNQIIASQEEKRNRLRSKQLSSKSTGEENNSWVCYCGTRNPDNMKYCRRCMKNRNKL